MKSRLVQRVSSWGLLLALGAGAGCFQPDPEFAPPLPPEFEADVGQIEWETFRDQVPRVLQRNDFQIQDRNEPPAPRVRTAWLEREPFPDEREDGAAAARTQVVVRGTPVRDSPLFLVTVRVVNEVRRSASGPWTEVESTPLFTEYADGITRAVAAGLHGDARARDGGEEGAG